MKAIFTKRKTSEKRPRANADIGNTYYSYGVRRKSILGSCCRTSTGDVMFQSLKAVCLSSMAMPPIPAENSVPGKVKLYNQQGTDEGHSTIPLSIKSQTDQYLSIISGASAFCVIFL